MGFGQAVLLGIVQGLTEFLPVSSSGHLTLAQRFLGITEAPLLLEAALHLGTIVAVIVYFRQDFIGMARSVVSSEGEGKQNRRLLLLLVLGSLPAAVIGVALKSYFEEAFSSVPVVSAMLLVTGAILWSAESRQVVIREKRPLDEIRWPDSLGIGFAQAVAIMPGISRSGSTITMGLWLGLEAKAAARFTFLLSVPAVLGANVVALAGAPAGASITPAMGLGALVSFLVGLAAIAGMLRILERHHLRAFAYYCFALGSVSFLAYYLH